jgi:hypothetical protein
MRERKNGYTPRNPQQAVINGIHKILGGQTVALRVDWAKRLNSIHTAIVLQQLIFEGRHHADLEGWFFITADNLHDTTAVGKEAYATARKKLEDLQIIEAKRAGVPAKTFIRINHEKLTEWITAPQQDGGNPQTELREPEDKMAGTRHVLRESTGESNDDTFSPDADASGEKVSSKNNGDHHSTTTDMASAEGAQPSLIYQIVKAWVDVAGIDEFPPPGTQPFGMAKNAEAAGLNPEDVAPIYRWLRPDPFWEKKGIDIANISGQRSKWLSLGKPGAGNGTSTGSDSGPRRETWADHERKLREKDPCIFFGSEGSEERRRMKAEWEAEQEQRALQHVSDTPAYTPENSSYV